MYLKPKDIICKFEKKNCFANMNGYCIILDDMPEKMKCPFYKPRYKEEGGEYNSQSNIF